MKNKSRNKDINRSVLKETQRFNRQRISAEEICDECGQDHFPKPSFDKIRTSIDTFSELLRQRGIIITRTRMNID